MNFSCFFCGFQEPPTGILLVIPAIISLGISAEMPSGIPIGILHAILLEFPPDTSSGIAPYISS